MLGGSAGLRRRVRWVHVGEVADIAEQLSGGELVLTTGVLLPTAGRELRHYVLGLTEAGASGLVVELGRRYSKSLPTEFVVAADEFELPLIALRREIQFVRVTQAVHERIVGVQLERLRASEHSRRVFSEMSVEGAGTTDVVDQLARMAGCPVVLESPSHHVIAFAGADPSALADWEQRARTVRVRSRTEYHEPSGWLVTQVGARGRDWGRLILVCDSEPDDRLIAMLEHASTALVLNRLVDTELQELDRQAQRRFLTSLLGQRYIDAEALSSHAAAVGLLVRRRTFVGILIGRVDAPAGDAREELLRQQDLVRWAADTVGRLELNAALAPLEDGTLAILMSRPKADGEDAAVGRLAEALQAGGSNGLLIAAGSDVEALRDARRSFSEAAQGLAIAQQAPPGPHRVHRAKDLQLEGLLVALADDPRLERYVEAKLGALLEHDANHGSDLLGVLRIYLHSGRNKSLAAQRAHLSRPALYARLHRVEAILAADLADESTCLALQVAVLARTVAAAGDTTASGYDGLPLAAR